MYGSKRSRSARPRSRNWILLSAFLGAAVLGALLLPEAKAESKLEAKTKLEQAQRDMKVAERMIRTGQIDDGMEKMRSLVESFPKVPRFLQQYSSQLRRQDRLDEAIALYEERIKEKDVETFLMQELEGMYRESSRLEDAFDLCLVYEARSNQRGHWVVKEIESILRTRELGVESVKKIEKVLEKRPANSRLHRVRLTALYFAGEGEQALVEAEKLDQKRKADGGELFAYAMMIEQHGGLEDAVAALELLVASAPGEPLREQVFLKRAKLLRKLRRLDETLLAYDEFLVAYPNAKSALSVLRTRASILDKEQGRTKEALSAYERVLAAVTPIKGPEDIKIANQTQLAMANCHLLLGSPEKAGELYQTMADEATDPSVRVEAIFQVAEMLYFQGMTDDAETKYYEIVDNFPTSTWVNDALDRILLIGENSDMDGIPLAALAQAEFQQKMGRIQKGLALLAEAEESFPQSEAVDNLMFSEIDLRLTVGEIDEAAVTADSLAARYPESVLAPRGLKRIADYYAESTGGKPMAKKIYTDILLRFPDALEIPEVRSQLQSLEGRGSDSSALWSADMKGLG